MSAKNKLLEYISRYINFSPEEMKIFMSVIEVSNLKKKQMIVQPGFVCQYMCYITKGALRSYFVDQEGNEHCIGFAVDDWWISDYNSFIYQEPATLFVEALENSVTYMFPLASIAMADGLLNRAAAPVPLVKPCVLPAIVVTVATRFVGFWFGFSATPPASPGSLCDVWTALWLPSLAPR